MGMCKSCGNVVATAEMINGTCSACHSPKTAEEIKIDAEQEQEQLKNLKKNIKTIFLTTETTIDMSIEQRLEIVTAQDISFILSIENNNDILGSLEQANINVIEKLKVNTLSIGGNAVIGVRIEHTYSNNFLSVNAIGTALKIKH